MCTCRVRSSCVLLSLALTVGASSASLAEDAPLRVQARLLELPRTPFCKTNEVRVTALYRVERVLSGRAPAAELLVVHRCPEAARGPSGIGRGDAGRLRPGDRHILTLRPMTSWDGVLDRFTDRGEPRHAAVVTDQGPPLPRVVVVVDGGAGAHHKVTVEAEEVLVGSAPDADVRLDHPSVAPRQLRLRLRGERLAARDLEGSGDLACNGKPLRGTREITYEDRLTVGPYTLRAALFLDPPAEEP